MKRVISILVILCSLVLASCGAITAGQPVVVQGVVDNVQSTAVTAADPDNKSASTSGVASGTDSAVAVAQPTALPTALPIAPLNQNGQVGFGAYLTDTPFDSFAALRVFETQVAHKMEYTLWFQAWGDMDNAFPEAQVKLAHAFGYVPVITWEPWVRNFQEKTYIQLDYALESIAAGRHDDYLRTWAQAARDARVPVIIRFAHEQSTEPGVISWYPWQGNPAGYKAAFRHVVQVFRQEMAFNVQFLWSAMWLDSWAGQYYPGNDVVDYVGTTVLNHGLAPGESWAVWRSFDELTRAQYQAAEQWGKPVFLTEVATAEQGGSKAAWLAESFAIIRNDYPLVRGVLFLEVSQDREWPQINWSITASPESLEVVKDLLQDPYYR